MAASTHKAPAMPVTMPGTKVSKIMRRIPKITMMAMVVTMSELTMARIAGASTR